MACPSPRSGARGCKRNFGEYRKLEDSRYASQAKFPIARGRAFLCPFIGLTPNSTDQLIYAVVPAKGTLRRWRRGDPVAETYNHRLWKYGSPA